MIISLFDYFCKEFYVNNLVELDQIYNKLITYQLQFNFESCIIVLQKDVFITKMMKNILQRWNINYFF